MSSLKIVSAPLAARPSPRVEEDPRHELPKDLLRYGKDVFQWGADQARKIFHPATPPVIVDVDPKRLEADVREIVSDFSPRGIRNTENQERLVNHLTQRFARHGARVVQQSYQVVDTAKLVQELKDAGTPLRPEHEAELLSAEGKTFRNVIASFGPEEGERLVIGAHYDTDGALPGADDNATGVAALLEMARHLGEKAPDKRIDLVAFVNEERPLGLTGWMGSRIYAKSLKDGNVAVKGMLSLEMLGYFSSAPDSQNYPQPAVVASAMRKLFGSEGDFLAVIGRAGESSFLRSVHDAIENASTLETHYLAAPALIPDRGRSDHDSFWRELRNVPAAMVTDTANLRNTEYHRNDTPERLDYVRMAEGVKGLINFVYQSAR